MKHNWEYKKINDLGIIKSGYTPSSDDLATNGDFPYFKVAEMNLPGNEKYLIHAPSYLSGEIKTFPANSIVFPKNGAAVSTNKKRILQVDSVVDLNTAVMLANQNISVNYLYYILINIDFANLVKRGAVPTLNISELKNIIVPVPPMETQEQIAAELDQINDLIAKNRELLLQLDALAQSLFYDTFGDPLTNPKGWSAKRFKDILYKIGSGATPRGGKQSYQGGEVSLIRSLNVYNTYFKYDELAKINDEQAYELRNVEVLHYDVLLNITGASVARCFIVPVDTLPARVNQHVAILRPNNKYIKSIYLHRLLITPTFQNYLIGTARGKSATREALPKATLEMIEIPVPPLALQEDFAAKVEAIEAQKAKVEAEIVELQTLLDARMDYWFN